tara:strand:+ start:264 stop:425 length:162 start_codon:yes stop_codon:yes gene_type:complete
MINYYHEYQQELKRADLLQSDLDVQDEIHFNEISSLRAELVLLKQQLSNRRIN